MSYYIRVILKKEVLILTVLKIKVDMRRDILYTINIFIRINKRNRETI